MLDDAAKTKINLRLEEYRTVSAEIHLYIQESFFKFLPTPLLLLGILLASAALITFVFENLARIPIVIYILFGFCGLIGFYVYKSPKLIETYILGGKDN